MTRLIQLFILFLITLLISCDSDSKVIAPDVSNIDIDLEVQRFDEALSNIDTLNIHQSYVELNQRFPELTELYFKRLVPLYNNNQDSFYHNLKGFLTDKRIRSIATTTQETYPDLNFLNKEITSALKFYKYYFPNKVLPEFYSFYSEFSYQPIIFNGRLDKDAIGIGLDMFLGNDFDYKSIDPTNPVFSSYLARTYNKEHLTKKTIDVLVEDIVGQPPGKRFIDQMINRGKKTFVLKMLLPFVHDSIIHEYTQEQLSWVDKNELQIWDFFLEQNIMYETNHFKITKYLDYSPSSKGMPTESPGRTGSYMGYKIVEAFMNRNEDVTVQELINYKDSQQLLERSKYKPKRK